MAIDHIKTKISNYVLAKIIGGNTGAGGNVYADYLYGTHPYPCVNITIPESTYNEGQNAGLNANGDIDHGEHLLVIEVAEKNLLSAVKTVNSICAEIKAIIGSDEMLGGMVSGVDLVKEHVVSTAYFEERVVQAGMFFKVLTTTARNDITNET